jgi:small subunit ribosomal protein S13
MSDMIGEKEKPKAEEAQPEAEDGKKASDSAEEPREEEKKERKAEKKDTRRNIVRVGGKDLDGDVKLQRGIRDIRGVGFTLASAAAKVSGLADRKIGELKEDEIKKVEDIVENPAKYGIPSWMYNRRLDPESGGDGHNISAKLELRQKMDINELKKRKCYRGIRHIQGLPVRGQRTRSSFRKSATVGVSRAKAKPGETKKK